MTHMSNKQLVEDLKAARAVIEKEEHWAKGHYAFDAKWGWADAKSADACRFCGLGAVQKVTDGERGDRASVAEKFLNDVIRRDGLFQYFHGFNDSEDTTHADVLAAFDRAIAAAEAL